MQGGIGPFLVVRGHCVGAGDPASSLTSWCDIGQVLDQAREIFSERMNEFNFLELLFPSLAREYSNARLPGLLRRLSDNTCTLLSMAPGPMAGTQCMFVAVDQGDRRGIKYGTFGCWSSCLQSKLFLPWARAGGAPARGRALRRLARAPAAASLSSPVVMPVMYPSAPGGAAESSTPSSSPAPDENPSLGVLECQRLSPLDSVTNRKEDPPCSPLLWRGGCALHRGGSLLETQLT